MNEVVMTIAGNDPSGGAGIQADIEAIGAMGCHPAPVITSLTVQDTRNATRIEPVAPELVLAQAEAVLADSDVKAIKLGLLATVDIALAVADLLARHAHIPVVLDPVLIAGGGARLAEAAITGAMRERLVPRALVVTPNTDEMRALVPDAPDLDEAARRLAALGTGFVLLKGAHEDTPTVVNRLVDAQGVVERWEWPREGGGFHGSGCTLASAVAAGIARGREPLDAAADAQAFVQDALAHALRTGRGQKIPNRRRQ